jgi:hypothetical protein
MGTPFSDFDRPDGHAEAGLERSRRRFRADQHRGYQDRARSRDQTRLQRASTCAKVLDPERRPGYLVVIIAEISRLSLISV